MPQLQVQLLGDFQLRMDGESLSIPHSNQQNLLLAYLLLKREAPQPRRHIAFQFWPDTNEPQALSNLRTLFHRLRRNIPMIAPFLESNQQTLQWHAHSNISIDVAQFEDALKAGFNNQAALKTAVDLYHGSLLPGWYEAWIDPERERLRYLFIDVAEKLVVRLENAREYRQAIFYAQKILRHDPINEQIYRRLMRLHALNQDRATAIQIYHSCVSTLEQEVGVEPQAETQAIYEQLLRLPTQMAVAPEKRTVEPTLINRHHEWEQLLETWQTAQIKKSQFVLISGESGIGKTRLAEAFVQWAANQGIDTAVSRGYATEKNLAFAPIVGWLRTAVVKSALQSLEAIWLTEIARLLPELLVEQLALPAPTAITQSWEQQRFYEALLKAITATNRPILLLIDDLQWCDSETVTWLHYLLRAETAVRLMIIGITRPNSDNAIQPYTDLLTDLQRSEQLLSINLAPFNQNETAELAASIIGKTLDEKTAVRLFHETEGNPLFTVEMIRSGWLETMVQHPPLMPDPFPAQHALPPSIIQILSDRLNQLSPPAKELIGLASVIGYGFSFTLLHSASQLDENSLVHAVDELWQQRIIREQTTGSYDFSHDKMREVAYAQLSPVKKRLFHQRVAQALSAQHASNLDPFSGQIGAHYELAGLFKEAIPHYYRAAQAAQQLYAHDEAMLNSQRGLNLLSNLPTQLDEAWQQTLAANLYECQGDVLHFMTRYGKAREAYQMAQTAVSPSNSLWQARLHRKVGLTHIPQHHYELALTQYNLAKASLGSPSEKSDYVWWREWINIEHERKFVFYWLNRWEEIEEIMENGRAIVEKYATPTQRIRFFDVLALYFRKDRFAVTEKAVSYAKESLKAHQEIGDSSLIARAAFGLGFCTLWYGDLDEAEVHINHAKRLADQHGDLNLLARCVTYLTVIYRKRGNVEETKSLSEKSLTIATEANMPEYIGTAKANMAWVAWRHRHWQQVQKLGDEALDIWQKLPDGHASCAFQWTALFPLLTVALKTSNLSEAMSHARALLDLSQQKLADEVTAVLTQAITAWQQNDLPQMKKRLQNATMLAQTHLYL